MKKLFIITMTLVLLAGVATEASDLTLDAVFGTWSNPVGGLSITYIYDVDLTPDYGNDEEDQIRWGTDLGQGQSGLGFTGYVPALTDPCFISFDIGQTFEIGQLQHFNNPIGRYSSASAVDLTVDLDFSVPVVNPAFTFTFLINETDNAPGPPASDDIITFPDSYPAQIFTLYGEPHTLQILGFGPDADNLSDSFISPEGGTNATLLWGRITPPSSVIPAPGAIFLGGIGVSLVGWLRRRRTL